MSSNLKPITLWGQGGTNPPKIAILLAELNLPTEVIPTPMTNVKNPEYLAINPNGRVPAIHDPNTGITLWESGAIVEYLIETYDTELKFSFTKGTPEAWHAKQWLFFQATGQGPYYGQAAWFKKFHHEQLPSAIERYTKEINRVSGVLDGWLAQQKEKYGSSGGDGPWLVGDKLSYADLAFVSWQKLIPLVVAKDEYDVDDFPYVKEWLGKMSEREAVKKVLAARSGH